MADLSGVVLDAEGAPVARAQVSARLVDPGTGRPVTGWTSSGTITRGKTISVTTDDNGAWTLDLVPNDDITPDGTGWGIVQDGRPQVIVDKGSTAETMSTVTVLDDAALPATPAAISQAITSGLVPAPVDVAAKVAKAGDTMSGDLAMGSNRVTGLAAPSADTDAARKFDATPARARGLTLRNAVPASFGALLDDARTTPVNVLSLTDSIGQWYGKRAWTWVFADAIGEVTGGRRPGSTLAPTLHYPNIAQFDTNDRYAPRNETLAGYGSRLAPGEKATFSAADCDGVSIMYRTQVGSSAALTVRIVSPSITLGTITDNAAETRSGNVWTSTSLTRADYTFEVEHTGASGYFYIECALPHRGNRASGVRVWNGGRAGALASEYLTNRTWGLEQVETMQPEAVMVAFGTNGGDHATEQAALIAEIRAASPSTLVIGIVTYENNNFPAAEVDEVRAVLDAHADVVVDMPTFLPDVIRQGLSDDYTHLNAAGAERYGLAVATALSGDPLGILAGVVSRKVSKAPQPGLAEEVSGTVAATTVSGTDGSFSGVLTGESAVVVGDTEGDLGTVLVPTATDGVTKVSTGAGALGGLTDGTFLVRAPTADTEAANKLYVDTAESDAVDTAASYTDARATDRLWVPADDFRGLTVADRGTAGRAATLAADTDYSARYSVDLPAHWTAFNVVYVYEAADATAGNIYLRFVYQQHPNGGGAIPAGPAVGAPFAAPGHTDLAEATVAGPIAVTGRRIDLRAFLNRAHAADTYTGVVYLRGLALVAA